MQTCNCQDKNIFNTIITCQEKPSRRDIGQDYFIPTRCNCWFLNYLEMEEPN